MAITSYLGLETALSGLQTAQRQLDLTGQNIANANTPGYTRQVATTVESAPYPDWPGPRALGTGATVTAYTRMRDAIVDSQVRAQSQQLGYQQARQDGLQQVELAFNEPSQNGLSNLLDSYWSSWQGVANNPESVPARQSLVQAGNSLATGFQALRSQLSTIDSQTQTGITSTLADLNNTLSQVAAADQQVMTSTAEGVPPSPQILDQRDLLLDKLASMANITVAAQPDGSTTLSVGAVTILSGGTASPVANLAALGANLTSGKLAGLASLDASITGAGGYLAKLDTAASALITSVNSVQAAGFTLAGTAATQPFFTGTSAADIAANPALVADPSLVAASTQANQPGNGDNAIAAAGLAGSATIDGAYQALVTTVGTDSQDAQRGVQLAQVMSDALQNRRQSISGVSIDEEMTNMIQYQRAYEACARTLSAMDDALTTLIQKTGRVGL